MGRPLTLIAARQIGQVARRAVTEGDMVFFAYHIVPRETIPGCRNGLIKQSNGKLEGCRWCP